MYTEYQEKNKLKNFSTQKHYIKCGFCGCSCTKGDLDIGMAAEKARKKGWATVRVGKRADPKKWACCSCLQDPKTFK